MTTMSESSLAKSPRWPEVKPLLMPHAKIEGENWTFEISILFSIRAQLDVDKLNPEQAFACKGCGQ